MITSDKSPHIKQLIALHDKKRERDATGLFLVEGIREINYAREVEVIYYAEESEWTSLKRSEGKTLVQLSEALFAKVSYREAGAIAIVKKQLAQLTDIASGSFFLVVEALEKPGNLGALMRTADSVGVDALLVVDEVVDIFNPNVVRSSMGSILHLPIVQLTSAEAIQFFKEKKIKIIATTPHTDQIYYKADMSGPVAIVIGSERAGLSPAWQECDSIPVKIPMVGVVDSLNASATGAIVLYEALRQRSTP